METNETASGEDLEKLESPFPWTEVRHVPGTSVVNASAMLLDAAGACIGLVLVLNTKDAGVLFDVERALSASSNPAKIRRFMQIARKEAVVYASALDAANAHIAELEAQLDPVKAQARAAVHWGQVAPDEIG